MEDTMKFEIRITHERVDVLRVPEGSVGIVLLDRVRAETRVPLLALDRVQGRIEAMRRNSIWMEVSEETARDSGLFKHKSEITVLRREVLPPEDYVCLKLDITRDAETGEIEEAGFFYEVDEALILADWIAAG